MVSESLRSSSVRPRLLTIVSVSQEKHRVSACTLVAADLPLSPDRVAYEVHCAFHAVKSVPRSTCRSSLGRSLSLKTYGMVVASKGGATGSYYTQSTNVTFMGASHQHQGMIPGVTSGGLYILVNFEASHRSRALLLAVPCRI